MSEQKPPISPTDNVAPSRKPYDYFLLGIAIHCAPESRYCVPNITATMTDTQDLWAFAQGLGGLTGISGPENFEEMRARAFSREHCIMFGSEPLAVIGEIGRAHLQALREGFEKWMQAHGDEGFYVSAGESAKYGEERKINPSVKAADLVDTLNALLDVDRAGMSKLLMTRHAISEKLADHPNAIVSPDGQLGALGLLNGLLPKRENGMGIIIAEYEDETGLVRRVRLASAMVLGEVESPPPAMEKRTEPPPPIPTAPTEPPLPASTSYAFPAGGDDGRDWTGEIKVQGQAGPTTPALSLSLRSDAITLDCWGNELSFSREDGSCLSESHRGLRIHADEMYRVHPRTYQLRAGDPLFTASPSDKEPNKS